jgi:AcrR family transcriptional regulator
MMTKVIALGSLRERKRLRTRQHIVETARALFAERGFDAVTVSDVAKAAYVADQTVYNYFNTKEALIFDEEAAYRERFVAIVSDREPFQPLSEVVRAEVSGFLDILEVRKVSKHRKGGMPFLVVTSPAVRRHWLALLDEYANAMANALSTKHSGVSFLAAKLLARSIVAIYGLVIDEVGDAIRKREPHSKRIRQIRPQILLSIQQISSGWRAMTEKHRGL